MAAQPPRRFDGRELPNIAFPDRPYRFPVDRNADGGRPPEFDQEPRLWAEVIHALRPESFALASRQAYPIPPGQPHPGYFEDISWNPHVFYTWLRRLTPRQTLVLNRAFPLMHDGDYPVAGYFTRESVEHMLMPGGQAHRDFYFDAPDEQFKYRGPIGLFAQLWGQLHAMFERRLLGARTFDQVSEFFRKMLEFLWRATERGMRQLVPGHDFAYDHLPPGNVQENTQNFIRQGFECIEAIAEVNVEILNRIREDPNQPYQGRPALTNGQIQRYYALFDQDKPADRGDDDGDDGDDGGQGDGFGDNANDQPAQQQQQDQQHDQQQGHQQDQQPDSGPDSDDSIMTLRFQPSDDDDDDDDSSGEDGEVGVQIRSGERAIRVQAQLGVVQQTPQAVVNNNAPNEAPINAFPNGGNNEPDVRDDGNFGDNYQGDDEDDDEPEIGGGANVDQTNQRIGQFDNRIPQAPSSTDSVSNQLEQNNVPLDRQNFVTTNHDTPNVTPLTTSTNRPKDVGGVVVPGHFSTEGNVAGAVQNDAGRAAGRDTAAADVQRPATRARTRVVAADTAQPTAASAAQPGQQPVAANPAARVVPTAAPAPPVATVEPRVTRQATRRQVQPERQAAPQAQPQAQPVAQQPAGTANASAGVNTPAAPAVAFPFGVQRTRAQPEVPVRIQPERAAAKGVGYVNALNPQGRRNDTIQAATMAARAEERRRKEATLAIAQQVHPETRAALIPTVDRPPQRQAAVAANAIERQPPLRAPRSRTSEDLSAQYQEYSRQAEAAKTPAERARFRALGKEVRAEYELQRARDERAQDNEGHPAFREGTGQRRRKRPAPGSDDPAPATAAPMTRPSRAPAAPPPAQPPVVVPILPAPPIRPRPNVAAPPPTQPVNAANIPPPPHAQQGVPRFTWNVAPPIRNASLTPTPLPYEDVRAALPPVGDTIRRIQDQQPAGPVTAATIQRAEQRLQELTSRPPASSDAAADAARAAEVQQLQAAIPRDRAILAQANRATVLARDRAQALDIPADVRDQPRNTVADIVNYTLRHPEFNTRDTVTRSYHVFGQADRAAVPVAPLDSDLQAKLSKYTDSERKNQELISTQADKIQKLTDDNTALTAERDELKKRIDRHVSALQETKASQVALRQQLDDVNASIATAQRTQAATNDLQAFKEKIETELRSKDLLVQAQERTIQLRSAEAADLKAQLGEFKKRSAEELAVVNKAREADLARYKAQSENASAEQSRRDAEKDREIEEHKQALRDLKSKFADSEAAYKANLKKKTDEHGASEGKAELYLQQLKQAKEQHEQSLVQHTKVVQEHVDKIAALSTQNLERNVKVQADLTNATLAHIRIYEKLFASYHISEISKFSEGLRSIKDLTKEIETLTTDDDSQARFDAQVAAEAIDKLRAGLEDVQNRAAQAEGLLQSNRELNHHLQATRQEKQEADVAIATLNAQVKSLQESLQETERSLEVQHQVRQTTGQQMAADFEEKLELQKRAHEEQLKELGAQMANIVQQNSQTEAAHTRELAEHLSRISQHLSDPAPEFSKRIAQYLDKNDIPGALEAVTQSLPALSSGSAALRAQVQSSAAALNDKAEQISQLKSELKSTERKREQESQELIKARQQKDKAVQELRQVQQSSHDGILEVQSALQEAERRHRAQLDEVARDAAQREEETKAEIAELKKKHATALKTANARATIVERAIAEKEGDLQQLKGFVAEQRKKHEDALTEAKRALQSQLVDAQRNSYAAIEQSKRQLEEANTQLNAAVLQKDYALIHVEALQKQLAEAATTIEQANHFNEEGAFRESQIENLSREREQLMTSQEATMLELTTVQRELEGVKQRLNDEIVERDGRIQEAIAHSTHGLQLQKHELELRANSLQASLGFRNEAIHLLESDRNAIVEAYTQQKLSTTRTAFSDIARHFSSQNEDGFTPEEEAYRQRIINNAKEARYTHEKNKKKITEQLAEAERTRENRKRELKELQLDFDDKQQAQNELLAKQGEELTKAHLELFQANEQVDAHVGSIRRLEDEVKSLKRKGISTDAALKNLEYKERQLKEEEDKVNMLNLEIQHHNQLLKQTEAKFERINAQREAIIDALQKDLDRNQRVTAEQKERADELARRLDLKQPLDRPGTDESSQVRLLNAKFTTYIQLLESKHKEALSTLQLKASELDRTLRTTQDENEQLKTQAKLNDVKEQIIDREEEHSTAKSDLIDKFEGDKNKARARAAANQNVLQLVADPNGLFSKPSAHPNVATLDSLTKAASETAAEAQKHVFAYAFGGPSRAKSASAAGSAPAVSRQDDDAILPAEGKKENDKPPAETPEALKGIKFKGIRELKDIPQDEAGSLPFGASNVRKANADFRRPRYAVRPADEVQIPYEPQATGNDSRYVTLAERYPENPGKTTQNVKVPRRIIDNPRPNFEPIIDWPRHEKEITEDTLKRYAESQELSYEHVLDLAKEREDIKKLVHEGLLARAVQGGLRFNTRGELINEQPTDEELLKYGSGQWKSYIELKQQREKLERKQKIIPLSEISLTTSTLLFGGRSVATSGGDRTRTTEAGSLSQAIDEAEKFEEEVRAAPERNGVAAQQKLIHSGAELLLDRGSKEIDSEHQTIKKSSDLMKTIVNATSVLNYTDDTNTVSSRKLAKDVLNAVTSLTGIQQQYNSIPLPALVKTLADLPARQRTAKLNEVAAALRPLFERYRADVVSEEERFARFQEQAEEVDRKRAIRSKDISGSGKILLRDEERSDGTLTKKRVKTYVVDANAEAQLMPGVSIGTTKDNLDVQKALVSSLTHQLLASQGSPGSAELAQRLKAAERHVEDLEKGFIPRRSLARDEDKLNTLALAAQRRALAQQEQQVKQEIVRGEVADQELPAIASTQEAPPPRVREQPIYYPARINGFHIYPNDTYSLQGDPTNPEKYIPWNDLKPGKTIDPEVIKSYQGSALALWQELDRKFGTEYSPSYSEYEGHRPSFFRRIRSGVPIFKSTQ